jgi:Galactose oxidase, central domain
MFTLSIYRMVCKFSCQPSHIRVLSIMVAWKPISTLSSSQSKTAPTPRVGTASTCLGGKVYLFSGRGGVAMTAIEENGLLWTFDCSPSTASSTPTWTLISPADPSAPYPEGRSYHALTNDDSNIIYLHGGCPATGRLSDLWAFNISSRTWIELIPAPGSGRGGSSIAMSGDCLYRMNGFDGKTEQGGNLDIYMPSQKTWSPISYTPNGIDGPEPRSVSCLLAVQIQGRPCLMTAFGEHDPSPLGHQGAGRMLDDIWVFDIQTSKWSQVNAADGSSERPAARGWFDADVLRAKGGSSDKVVIAGGLAEDNQRLSDLWILEFPA